MPVSTSQQLENSDDKYQLHNADHVFFLINSLIYSDFWHQLLLEVATKFAHPPTIHPTRRLNSCVHYENGLFQRYTPHGGWILACTVKIGFFSLLSVRVVKRASLGAWGAQQWVAKNVNPISYQYLELRVIVNADTSNRLFWFQTAKLVRLDIVNQRKGCFTSSHSL